MVPTEVLVRVSVFNAHKVLIEEGVAALARVTHLIDVEDPVALVLTDPLTRVHIDLKRASWYLDAVLFEDLQQSESHILILLDLHLHFFAAGDPDPLGTPLQLVLDCHVAFVLVVNKLPEGVDGDLEVFMLLPEALDNLHTDIIFLFKPLFLDLFLKVLD